MKNKKGWKAALFLGLALAASSFQICAGAGVEEKENHSEEILSEENLSEEETSSQTIVLKASQALITGQGIDVQGNVVDTQYSEELQGVINLGTGSQIIYTVPEAVQGDYDIYLDISKAYYPFGTTYVTVAVNEGAPTAMPVYLERSTKEDYSDLYEKKPYLVKLCASLKAGDQIVLTAMAGYEMEVEGAKTSLMPSAFADLTLKEARPLGETTGEEDLTEGTEDILAGKNIAWLGSSVTYGMMSGGYSMTNAIEDSHEGTHCFNYSISSTTLADQSESSYVKRLDLIDPDIPLDLFIVQLSTNDAALNMPLGEISQEKDIASFDASTVAGAMETIIATVQERWNCPVMFYTSPYFVSEPYAQMVELTGLLQEKWGIGLVDLWNNEEMRALYGTEEIKAYMADDSHPTYQGYVEWWTPVFEEGIIAYLNQQ